MVVTRCALYVELRTCCALRVESCLAGGHDSVVLCVLSVAVSSRLRMVMDLTSLVNELCSVWETATPTPASASDLVTLRPESWVAHEMQHLSVGNKNRLDKYIQKVNNDGSAFAFDLTQNAEHRCRVARHSHMATLTKNCGSWFIVHLKRCFCRSAE